MFSTTTQSCQNCHKQIPKGSPICTFCGFIQTLQTAPRKRDQDHPSRFACDTQNSKKRRFSQKKRSLTQKRRKQLKKQSKKSPIKFVFKMIFFLVFLGATIPFAMAIIKSFETRTHYVPDYGIEGTIGFTILAFLTSLTIPLPKKLARFIASIFTGLSAFLLISKPIIAPILFTSTSYHSNSSQSYHDIHALGLTSETHLYFLIPGIFLALVAFVFILRLGKD